MPKSKKKTKKEIKVIPVYLPVIFELQKFQGLIDNPKKKMLVKDIRAWAGHMNFIMTQLLRDVSAFIVKNETLSELKDYMIEERESLKNGETNYFS